METTTRRQQASFRLNADLLERLKIEAKKSNRSLNNYVESALMSVVYREPNQDTINAIEEVKSGKHLSNNPLDLTSVDSMIKTILE